MLAPCCFAGPPPALWFLDETRLFSMPPMSFDPPGLDPLVCKALEKRLTDLLAIAERHWKRSFTMPLVSYDLRGRSAGQALQVKNLVRFNRTLLLENQESFLFQTVGHELAHILCWQVYGHRVRPHGKEWRQVMAVLGLPPNRCHTYDTARSTTRKKLATFPYACRCRTREMTIIRHRRMLKSPGYYRCLQCGEALRAL